MRFVPTNCLRVGMVVGENLYNQAGDLLLSRGTPLTDDYIYSIERLKYNGIYIEDDISRDIDIINIVSDKVRAKTVSGIKNAFVDVSKNSGDAVKSLAEAKEQVEQIVDEICNNPSLMINMVDMKVFDDYTYYHSVNVAILSIVIGVALGMEREELCNLGYGALLHDIGKVFIDKDLLNKKGKLTAAEFQILKNHSLLGYEHIKKGYGVSKTSCMAILDHHERYSGGGYPNGLSGNNISLYGRIISVADVYDALTSDRPYRRAMIPAEAIEYIMASTETLFDPKIVAVFVKKISPYPIGTCVKLSDGNTGIVLENREELCLRPKLRIFKDKDGFLDEPYIMDLADFESLNVTIVDVVS